MKKTNILVIANLFDGAKAIEVPNFSDENVKSAISKLMEIKTEDLQCISGSMNSGIYLITKEYRNLEEEIRPIFSDKNGSWVTEKHLDISYGCLYK